MCGIGGGGLSGISTSAFFAASIVKPKNMSRTTNTLPKTVTPITPILSPTTALSVLPPLLPSIGSLSVAAFLPCCVGFWRVGYAVSFGYGGAMLASGALQLMATVAKGASSSAIVAAHSSLYIFYGFRLCLFLYLRSRRMAMITPKDATWNERLKRLPLLACIAFLYFCMAAAPLRISAYTAAAEALAESAPVSSLPKIAALWATIAVGFGGFLLAAIGDWYKSKIKARDGSNKLVTTGPFRYLRHPNYTGEMIGWTCACLILPILQTCSYNAVTTTVRPIVPWLVYSLVGWFGICFPTLGKEATGGLEKKHKEKYGGTPEYEKWIKTSWSGPML